MSDINKKILKEISISMKKIIEYIDEKSTKVASKPKTIEGQASPRICLSKL